MMRVRVKLFAMVRERAGMSELELELPAPATVADAAAELVRRIPSFGEHAGTVAYAVNHAYAKAGDALDDGDELAVIPPVSGG